MAIFKIRKKQNPFVIIDKTCLQDNRLSWRAKGILIYLLGLPDDWVLHVPELIKHATERREAVYSALKELRYYGYIVHRQPRQEDGSYAKACYDVYEIPQMEVSQIAEHVDKPHVENPYTGKPYAVKPDPENPDPLINNKSSKYINNTTVRSANVEESNVCAVEEGLIGHSLTPGQKKQTAVVAEFFAKKLAMKKDDLAAQLELTLLDKTSFTFAGNHFLKKLNTLRKCLVEGKWRPLVTSEVKPPSEYDHLQNQLIVTKGEYWHWQRMQKIAEKANKPFEAITYGNLLASCEQRINELKIAITAIENEDPTEPALIIFPLCA